jgi:hypothetical protein
MEASEGRKEAFFTLINKIGYPEEIPMQSDVIHLLDKLVCMTKSPRCIGAWKQVLRPILSGGGVDDNDNDNDDDDGGRASLPSAHTVYICGEVLWADVVRAVLDRALDDAFGLLSMGDLGVPMGRAVTSSKEESERKEGKIATEMSPQQRNTLVLLRGTVIRTPVALISAKRVHYVAHSRSVEHLQRAATNEGGGGDGPDQVPPSADVVLDRIIQASGVAWDVDDDWLGASGAPAMHTLACRVLTGLADAYYGVCDVDGNLTGSAGFQPHKTLLSTSQPFTEIPDLFSLVKPAGKISITCAGEGDLDTILQTLIRTAKEIQAVSRVPGSGTSAATVTATAAAMLSIVRSQSSPTTNYNMTVSWSVRNF